MQEKEFSMDDAMKLWWFVTWRTALTLIIINVIIGAGVSLINIQTYGIEDTISTLLSIIVSVYFFKTAINRDYSSFRLSAIKKEEQE